MNVGTREKPVYMPAEYCNVLPGQSSMKKLSPDQTASMIRFACKRPHLNAMSITEDGLETLGLLPQSNSILVSFDW
jgi:eukaryotic translation initiation factor 2C